MSRVLVITSQPEVMDMLEGSLGLKDIEIVASFDGAEGLGLLEREPFGICYISLKLPDMGCMDVIRDARRFNIASQFIVVAEDAHRQKAAATLLEGAYDFLVLPANPGEVVLQLNRALRVNELEYDNRHLRSQLRNRYDFPMLTGTSAVVTELHRKVIQVAQTNSPALITGEPGVGKHYIAKTIHYNSLRGHKPFITINCSVVPESLLEPEIFGRETGGRSPANSISPGRLELARGGTVFLDLLDKMQPALQDRLLDAMRTGEYTRSGGTRKLPLEARMTAATSVDPAEAVRQGTLKPELLERLGSVRLHIPPLRQRKDDIPVILEHFMSEISGKLGRTTPRISREARDLLLRYDWPGNIIELENVADHAALLNTSGIISPDDLPETIQNTEGNGHPSGGCVDLSTVRLSGRGIILKEVVRDMESTLVFQALEKSGWNRSRAAELIGLKRTTLIEKMKNLGITEALRPKDTAPKDTENTDE